VAVGAGGSVGSGVDRGGEVVVGYMTVTCEVSDGCAVEVFVGVPDVVVLGVTIASVGVVVTLVSVCAILLVGVGDKAILPGNNDVTVGTGVSIFDWSVSIRAL
jgi:hypothetical protein